MPELARKQKGGISIPTPKGSGQDFTLCYGLGQNTTKHRAEKSLAQRSQQQKGHDMGTRMPSLLSHSNDTLASPWVLGKSRWLLAKAVSQLLRGYLDNAIITHRPEALAPLTQTEADNSLLGCDLQHCDC